MGDETVEYYLMAAWHGFNRQYLHGRLNSPVLSLMEGEQVLGVWDSKHREIRISTAVLRDHPWGVVLEVLKHEMAHQFTDEILRITDEPPHGPTFRSVCARMGVNPAASGVPEGHDLDPAGDRARRKIRALLALAASDQRHEAEAAMKAAHRWMAKHHLDTLDRGDRRFAFREVGKRKKRFQAYEKALATLLASHFFVSAIWVRCWDHRRGRVAKTLEICGTPAHLDTAEYVHSFVEAAADRLWAAHRLAKNIGSDRERARFKHGVVRGFRAKLDEQSEQLQETGLVLVPDAGLTDYIGQRYSRIVSRSRRVTPSRAWLDGLSAGRDLVLHRPISSHQRRGRLLPGD